MALTSDQYLMTAILSMDVYYRDPRDQHETSLYEKVQGSFALGGATENTSQFDNSSSGLGAVAWTWDGQTVLVYRGTDLANAFAFSKSLFNGYPLALGYYASSQTIAAARFYNQNETIGSTIVTGQSLGGGLAGFVSSIFNVPGAIYDNMPFAVSAYNVYKNAQEGSQETNLFDIIHGILIDSKTALEIYGGNVPI